MTAPYDSSLGVRRVSAGGPHLGGRAQVGGGAAGAGVWQHSAGTAADRRGQGGSLGGLRRSGRLAQDAVLLETGPGGAPAEEELVQQLHLWEGEEEGRRRCVGGLEHTLDPSINTAWAVGAVLVLDPSWLFLDTQYMKYLKHVFKIVIFLVVYNLSVQLKLTNLMEETEKTE